MSGFSKEKEKDRLSYLDFYKGICILLIIIQHSMLDPTFRKVYLFPYWVFMAVPILMVITGYVSSLSFEKNGVTLKSAYHPKNIICKLLRFIIPFLPVFIVEYIILYMTFGNRLTWRFLLDTFITGGIGPGNYYFPIMLQVVLIFPLIWAVIRKLGFKGLVICFAVNFAYEVFKTLIHMDPEVYRYIAFRYVFIISFGCYLFVKQKESNKKNNIWYYLAGVVGAIYIFVFIYTDLKPYFTTEWTKTSCFAVLYIFPLMLHIIKPNKIHIELIEILGRASLNIYYIQLIYFWYISEVIESFIPVTVLKIAFNLIICCALGVLYYKIESPLTGKLVKLIKK